MYKKRRIIIILISFSLILVLLGIFFLAGSFHNRNIFISTINTYTKNKEGICVTVANIKGDKKTITCYGKNGEKIDTNTTIPYEIGSITKTMTGYLIAKSVINNKISLDDKISKYIGVTPSYNPTIKELCTHSSAYGTYCPTHDFGKDKGIINPLYGIDSVVLTQDILNFRCEEKNSYDIVYSNFAMAVLGLVLEKVNGTYCYYQIENLCKELGMTNTGLNKTINNHGSWQWDVKDVYIAAGGISSTVDDMLIYAQSCLNSNIDYINMATSPFMQYSKANQIGLGWLRSSNNKYLWHGGAVNQYNCLIKTNLKNKCSIVVLSNYPATSEISVEDIGNAYLNIIGA